MQCQCDEKLREESGKMSETKPAEVKSKRKTKAGAKKNRACIEIQEETKGYNVNALDCEGGVESINLLGNSGNFVKADLQSSGNEIGTGKSKPNRKRKSQNQKTVKAHAEVPKLSPYFLNENEKKVNVKALGHESVYKSVALLGTSGNMVQDKGEENGGEFTNENMKSKKMRISKMQEHAEVRKASSLILNDNQKKFDAESQGYGSVIGSVSFLDTSGSFIEDKLQENGNEIEAGKSKPNSNRKSKNQKTAKDHAVVRKVSPYFQTDKEKNDNIEALGPESMFEPVTIMGTCGNVIQDKGEENGDETATEKFKFKKTISKMQEPVEYTQVRKVSPFFQNDNEKKVDVKSQGHGSVIGSVAFPATSGSFLEDKLQKSGNEIERGKNKPNRKRKSKNQKSAMGYTVVRKVSPYFQIDNEKKVNGKALGHGCVFEPVAFMGTCGNMIQDKGKGNGDEIATERIKSQKKRTPKMLEPVEHAQVRRVSPFFQNNNEKKVDVESRVYGSVIGSFALPGNSGSFLEDKLQENGGEIETGKSKPKRKRPKRQKTAKEHVEVRKVSPYFQHDNEKKVNVETMGHGSMFESVALMGTCGKMVRDNGEVNGDEIATKKIKSKKKRTCKMQEPMEDAEVRTVSPFFQNGNEMKVDDESQGYDSVIGSVALPGTSGDFFDDELQENGIEIETVEIESREMRKTENQKTVAHVEGRKVSPYFQCLTPCKQVQKPMIEGKCLKVNDSRKSAKSFSSLKVSPYFQKVPKVEENTDFGLLENKSSSPENPMTIKRTLSASEKRDEAYKRKTPDNTWEPPSSTFCLLQENHVHDPWRVLVICMLLNRTTGSQARGVISDFFNLCPDAKSCTQVAKEEIEQIIKSLGLQRKRAMMLQRLSREYLDESWTHVTQLHGVGKYAADAYAIFCTGKWDRVKPADHILNRYWEYLWSRN